jgi:hypothetical protein
VLRAKRHYTHAGGIPRPARAIGRPVAENRAPLGHTAEMKILFAVMLALGLASAEAQVQYQWKEANGTMVYSDRPPPNGAGSVKMIKAPPAPSFPLLSKPEDAKADPAKLDQKTPQELKTLDGKPGIAGKKLSDKFLDDKVKLAAVGQKAKEDAEDAAIAKANMQRCEQMRQNLKTLESGIRVTRVNQQGEQEYMSDADRLAKIQDTRKQLAQCK